MSQFGVSSESGDWLQFNHMILLAIGVVLVPSFGFLLYRKYKQSNTYEGVNENDLLKSKLAAARDKQQKQYDEFIKESEITLKEKSEQKKKENNDSDHKSDSKSKEESLHAGRGYFPLMGSSSGTTYRPAKKGGCKPCGGGGCG